MALKLSRTAWISVFILLLFMIAIMSMGTGPKEPFITELNQLYRPLERTARGAVTQLTTMVSSKKKQ
jgi:hypothetical protein